MDIGQAVLFKEAGSVLLMMVVMRHGRVKSEE